MMTAGGGADIGQANGDGLTRRPYQLAPPRSDFREPVEVTAT